MNTSTWPRLLYHKDKAPGGWRVDSEAERAKLGPGWLDALPSLTQNQPEDAPAQAAPAEVVTAEPRKRSRRGVGA
jgi:hypothetical protein